MWLLAQFLFPLLASTTLGLAINHNYLAFPFLVVTLWKFGFPETILILYVAIFDTSNHIVIRICEMMEGIGVVMHHQSCSLYIASIVTELIPPSRFVVQVTIPLLMQHMFILIKYRYKLSYIIIETVLEV